MGNIVLRSRALANMSDVEFEEDVDIIEEEDLFDDPLEGEETTHENHLVSILRQLISSGEIQILNNDHFPSMALPVIKKRPNLDQLKVKRKKCIGGLINERQLSLVGIYGNTSKDILEDKIRSRCLS